MPLLSYRRVPLSFPNSPCTVLSIAWDLRRSVAWSTPSDNTGGGGRGKSLCAAPPRSSVGMMH
jgi:hypothetical protein